MQSSSIIFFVLLCIMIVTSLVKPLFSKDKSAIWSPITIISLTFLYYVVKPSLGNFPLYGAKVAPHQYLFYFMAVLFYGCILIAFHITRSGSFPKWNSYFDANNVEKAASILFLIAMACYIPFRGFRTTIFAEDATVMTARTGLVSYFIDLISLLVSACCLAYIGIRNKKGLGIKKNIILLIIFYFTIVLFIVGGFRYRIVILLMALATTYHLYPVPRKINFMLLVPVGVVVYLFFAIMDTARSYGRGIDMEVAKSITLSQASKGAGESDDVFCYSIAVIDRVSTTGDYVYFEPIKTAALMPIPRAFFPSKPDGSYMTDIETKIIGDSYGGAAMFVFAEAFYAFGFLGVILYGLFIGWFCKKIWLNYQHNRDSFGALLLLALMNGFVYQWIARGYMASAFNDFIYFVILPFWIIALFNFKKVN